MARARLQVLLPSHPGSRMFFVTSGFSAGNWAAAVASLMQGPHLPARIPDLLAHGLLPVSDISLARSSAVSRRRLLRYYRATFVRPVSRQYDELAFSRTALEVVPSLSFRFAELQPQLPDIDLAHLDFDIGPASWSWYRVWCIVRISGRWPLTVFGGVDNPHVLPTCMCCGQVDVDVLHPLCDCSGCAHEVERFREAHLLPGQPSLDALVRAAFAMSSHLDLTVKVALVGKLVSSACASGVDAD